MAVRVVVNFSVRPGSAEAYASAWAPEYDRVNAEPGCLQYELFRSTRNADNFALLELWQDRAAFDAHWQLQKDRPRPGLELRDAPENRRVGKSGTEIYWEVVPYSMQEGRFRRSDGARDPDYDAGGPVRLVINQNAKEGMTDRYAEAWSPVYDLTNAEPGCIQYELFRSQSNAENLALLEHWASRADLETHLGVLRARAGSGPSAREFAGSPAERKVGRAGLEVFYRQQYYLWDGSAWRQTKA